MSDFEKNYKKRFEEEQLSNDDSDFDVDGIWGAIENGLEEKPKRRFFFLKFRWLFPMVLLLLTLGGSLGYWLITENKSLSVNESKADSSSNVISKNRNKVSYEGKLQSTAPEIKDVEPFIDIENQDEVAIVASKSVREKDSTLEESAANNFYEKQKTNDLLVTEHSENSNSFFSNKNIASENLITSKPISPPFQSTTESTKITIRESKGVLPIEPLPLNLISYEEENSFEKTLFPKELISIVKNKKWSTTTGLFAGANIINLKFESNTLSEPASQKSNTEKSEWGTSYGLTTSFIKENKWIFSTGFEQHNLWTKFDYREQKQVTVLRENQLLRIDVNSVTRDTLDRFFGDTLVNGWSDRHVNHFNEYKIFSIPLQFGFQQQIERFNIGINGGIVFNFVQSQNGKALNDFIEIVEFDGSTSNAPLSSFNVGFRLSPFVQYQLSEKWSLILNPQMNWQRSKGYNNTDIKTSLQQLNFNIGLNLKL